jgi:hypothetical protein
MDRDDIRNIVWEEMQGHFLPEIQKSMSASLSSILEKNIKEYLLTKEIGRRVVLPKKGNENVDLRMPIIQATETISDDIYEKLSEE